MKVEDMTEQEKAENYVRVQDGYHQARIENAKISQWFKRTPFLIIGLSLLYLICKTL